MSCIIHYEGQNQYDSVTQVTEKTSLKIKEAKQKHELLNDQHIPQCVLIPENEDLTKYFYHKKPCYRNKQFAFVTFTKSYIF